MKEENMKTMAYKSIKIYRRKYGRIYLQPRKNDMKINAFAFVNVLTTINKIKIRKN